MSKRRYQHVQELLPIIKEKIAEGKTQREIAEEFGLADLPAEDRHIEAGKRAH